MRTNRIAVATLAAVTAFVLGGKVGIGQQAPGANPAQGPQATVAAPLPLGYSGEAVYPSFEGWGPIQNGQNYILTAWWLATFPGLAVVFVGVAFSLIGDGLADVLRAGDR
jgi:hypothetical protein